MSPRIGSLCSGYGGLDMAVQAVFSGELAWWSDIDEGAIRIMTHHHPDVPNLGDFTQVEWVPICGAYEFDGCGRPVTVLPDRSGWQCDHCQKLWPTSLGKVYWPDVPEPIDILTAGYPCQPFSLAGQRKGTNDERHLWPYIREAIRVLRPRFVVLENVAGHRSMGADRVLGDLAEDGLCVRFVSVQASDTGACHGRERFIMLAHAEGEPWIKQYGDALAAAHAEDVGRQRERRARDGWARPEDSRLLPTPSARDFKDTQIRREPHRPTDTDTLSRALADLLPTPRATDHHDSMTASGAARHVADGNGTLAETLGVHLFPTPRASDGEKGGPGQRGSSGDLMLPSAVVLLPTPHAGLGDHNRANGQPPERRREQGRQVSIADIACHELVLLPTPTATSYGSNQSASDGAAVRKSLEYVTDWGKYATAIRRHELAFGRPAPSPVQPSSKGTPQLAPVFTEWMMGLPLGWVTDPAIWAGMLNAKGKPASKPAIRNAQLHALGNGVVPQQAVYALEVMLSWRIAASLGSTP